MRKKGKASKRRAAARKGGLATVRKHGKGHMRMIGRKGARELQRLVHVGHACNRIGKGERVRPRRRRR